MPELPDVEVYRRRIDPDALHREIASAAFGGTDLRQPIPEKLLRERLPGHSFTGTHRHGKFLFARLGDDGWLLLHFGMTGEILLLEHDDPEPKHTRLELRFEDAGRLAYTNMRKLGRVDLVDDPERFLEEEELGPDPIGDAMDGGRLRTRFAGARGTLKAALTDQQRIAGIGNIYADEILLEAGMNPRLPAQELSQSAVDRLAEAMREVLDAAIDADVDPDRMPEGFMIAERRDGGRCPRCGSELVKTKISGRSTYYCPHHQPEPVS